MAHSPRRVGGSLREAPQPSGERSAGRGDRRPPDRTRTSSGAPRHDPNHPDQRRPRHGRRTAARRPGGVGARVLPADDLGPEGRSGDAGFLSAADTAQGVVPTSEGAGIDLIDDIDTGATEASQGSAIRSLAGAAFDLIAAPHPSPRSARRDDGPAEERVDHPSAVTQPILRSRTGSDDPAPSGRRRVVATRPRAAYASGTAARRVPGGRRRVRYPRRSWNMLKAALIGSGFALAASQAAAIPVTLNPDRIFPQNERGTTGLFPGTGFRFSVETAEDFPDREDLPEIARITDGPSGVDNLALRFTVERVDGQPFDLEAFSIPSFYVGEVVTFDGDVLGPDGEVVESVFDFTENLTDFVALTGLTASGAAVDASLRPLKPDTRSPEFSFFENPSPRFAAQDVAPGFEDLVSLSFEVGGFTLDTFCDPSILGDVDPRFAQSPPCAPDAADPPLEDVDIGFDGNFALRNDLYYFDLGAIEVDSPSPIPVPASLPLLLGGLGALVLGARRAARRPT